MSLVEKLNQFVEDSDWTEPLSKKLHTQEINAFSCFPLEQNRAMMLGYDFINRCWFFYPILFTATGKYVHAMYALTVFPTKKK